MARTTTCSCWSPAAARSTGRSCESHLGVKRLSLPSADEAKDATGYERGTITPFGATHAWPVIADAATGAFGVVAIGAGAHGVNLHVDTSALLTALNADVADVARRTSPRLRRDPAPRHEPALSRRAVELAVLHQHLTALHHDLGEAAHDPSLVRRVVDAHVVRRRRDRPLLRRVEHHDVGVGTGSDRALRGYRPNIFAGAVATSSTNRFRSMWPVSTPPYSSVNRSSTDGRPFGIFEKSSFPRSFCPCS